VNETVTSSADEHIKNIVYRSISDRWQWLMHRLQRQRNTTYTA